MSSAGEWEGRADGMTPTWRHSASRWGYFEKLIGHNLKYTSCKLMKYLDLQSKNHCPLCWLHMQVLCSAWETPFEKVRPLHLGSPQKTLTTFESSGSFAIQGTLTGIQSVFFGGEVIWRRGLDGCSQILGCVIKLASASWGCHYKCPKLLA